MMTGIDLGTSNSAAAVLRAGKPVIIPSAEGVSLGGKAFPSSVAVTESGEVLVGEPVRRQAAANPDGTATAFKRRWAHVPRCNSATRNTGPSRCQPCCSRRSSAAPKCSWANRWSRPLSRCPRRLGHSQRARCPFARRGSDLWRTETAGVSDAALGASLEVPTIDGSVAVTVPAGTQPGEILRLRGKGLPVPGGGSGDLLLTIQVQMPDRLDRHQRRLSEEPPFPRRREVAMTVELKPGQLKRHFDPETLEFESTSDVESVEGIIGQPRALEAIRFGLEIEDPSFHVYAAGAPGTGRTKAVEAFLKGLAANQPVPSDWCYVNNFADASRPMVVRLEPGQGRQFAIDVARLIGRALRDVPGAFESDEFADRQSSIKTELEKEKEQFYTNLKAEAGSTDFLVETGPLGVFITPLINGRPISDELTSALTLAACQELAAKREAVQERVRQTLKHVRDAERRAQDELDDLKREVVGFLVGGLVDDLVEQYSDNEEVGAYLNELRDSITSNPDLFQRPEGPLAEMAAIAESADGSALRKYHVNVVVDRTDAEGAPVVIEPNPTYSNLFGTIEREARFGALHTDFTLLKPGAVHQANGGYLVLPVRDLLLNFLSYDSLKRALQSRRIEIEEPAERLGLTSTRTLRPAPIPLDLKVVLIGTPLLYHLLYLLDEDFPELFKVKAHFDTQMERNDEAVRDYASFVAALCAQEELAPLDRRALALVVEHSSRLAEDQAKLTAKFREIADVVREASHYARRRDSDRVEGVDVEAAIEARMYRSNLIEVRIREMITRGTLHIETTGTAIGQVNGLSILDLGDYSFGRPNRITASVSLGPAGVVDIEREAKLGGPIHAKGVMILTGFLADRFARDYPLSLTARLVFEQSYAGVEGDSASGAELLALISRLADLPASQEIAMTGAADQQGHFQAIGGVNEKIEGFYDLCRVIGLTGQQGVVIPEANVHNLMLREDVIQAVESGDFHVWAVSSIQQAVELLLGAPAGEPEADGSYPESTVFGRIDERLRAMATRLAQFGASRQVSDQPLEEGEADTPE